MPTLMAIGGVVASLLAASVLAEPSAGPPDRIEISVETVNGSGCPAGTTNVNTAADNTAFTVSYSNFLAEAGPAAKPVDSRKNCQLNLAVRVPAGFTYAIARVEHQGFAHLQNGATGQQLAHYYFTGTSPTAHVSHEFSGPYTGDWQTSDQAAALIYAPCGSQRNLNINTELRVDGGHSDSATSFITMDSSRGGVRTIYHLSWRTC
ncbi:DUF4360 domain-containing protein [Plantactinospora sp. CA-290183]|uniref:DUF4360 domain-containing protein n=1 Tax=Plantactinospora sp. CA-290183 TaxID=3240006 RepID=UPI003D8AA19F